MKTKTNTQYRQGDVLIERVSGLPKGLKKINRENGRVVLAHGEVTGHAHFFAETEVEKFGSKDGEEFFRVGGQVISARLKIERTWKEQVLVRHPKLGLLQFALSDVTIDNGFATIDGEFGILRHGLLHGNVLEKADHDAQAVPAGIYRGASAGGSVGQSEFDPEEIRRVID